MKPINEPRGTVTWLVKWHKAVCAICGTDDLAAIAGMAKAALNPRMVKQRAPAGMVSRLTPEERAAVMLALLYAKRDGAKHTMLDSAEFNGRIQAAEAAIKRVS